MYFEIFVCKALRIISPVFKYIAELNIENNITVTIVYDITM